MTSGGPGKDPGFVDAVATGLANEIAHDPRDTPRFVVVLHGAPGVGRASLRAALLDLPEGSEQDLARVDLVKAEELDATVGPANAALYVARGDPTDADRAALRELRGTLGQCVLLVVHARDLDPRSDEEIHERWQALERTDGSPAYLTATAPARPPFGIEGLRAALFTLALDGVEMTVAEARRTKRPYAAAIIGGAALATAAEGLLPGAAVLVVTSQIGAIGSLSYLYTGKWLGRGQALTLVPVFATEAAGGSLFLLAKSFFPPTGIADAAAAAVAASLTLSMLGAVAWTLEQGYTLDQKDKLRDAFRRLRSRSVAERAEILKHRGRWSERSFWAELAQKLLFEG